MTFLEAVGIGVGIGVVNAACVSVVLAAARRKVRVREDESLGLMRERNEIDREKVAAIYAINRCTHS